MSEGEDSAAPSAPEPDAAATKPSDAPTPGEAAATTAAPPPSEPPPPESSKKAVKPKRKRKGWLGRLLILFLVVTVAVPVGLTAVFRFLPPPVTILMVQRLFEGHGLTKRWRSLDDISPSLVHAVIAAEDARFCSHPGFDFEAIQKALETNEEGGPVRGGSTISQQTAKNVFLWPARSWVRKGLETYFTVLIEALWGKRRIMEVYLNVIEFGPGAYGAEAAAQRYFKTSAARLSRVQAARLAAVLPRPLLYRAAAPGPYVAGRSRRIAAAAGTVRQDQMAACVLG